MTSNCSLPISRRLTLSLAALALFAATELHEEEDLLALREALKEVLA